MVRLEIEGQIRQVGNTLQMDRDVIEMESVEQALEEVARRLGREPEEHEVVVHGHGVIWAIIP